MNCGFEKQVHIFLTCCLQHTILCLIELFKVLTDFSTFLLSSVINFKLLCRRNPCLIPPWYLDEVKGHPGDLSVLEALLEGTLRVCLSLCMEVFCFLLSLIHVPLDHENCKWVERAGMTIGKFPSIFSCCRFLCRCSACHAPGGGVGTVHRMGLRLLHLWWVT